MNINIQPVFSSNKKSLETINNQSLKKNESGNVKNKLDNKNDFLIDKNLKDNKEIKENKDFKISSNILKNTIKSNSIMTKTKYNQ